MGAINEQQIDNIELVESTIFDRLKTAKELEGFDIEPYPVDISKFDFISSKGCVLVRYENSNFSTPQTLYNINQTETIEFSVFIALRYLQKYKDSYKTLNLIKRLLTGLSIKGKRLYPKRRQFVDLVKGDLYWGYTFVTELPTSEDIDLENVIPIWERQP